jgi:hypothetical protein
MSLAPKSSLAVGALEWSLIAVNAYVLCQIALLRKRFVAELTSVRLLAGVLAHMHFEVAGGGMFLTAHIAAVLLLDGLLDARHLNDSN